jgi:hypothetical protein
MWLKMGLSAKSACKNQIARSGEQEYLGSFHSCGARGFKGLGARLRRQSPVIFAIVLKTQEEKHAPCEHKS